jgi:hypothetical protein
VGKPLPDREHGRLLLVADTTASTQTASSG